MTGWLKALALLPLLASWGWDTPPEEPDPPDPPGPTLQGSFATLTQDTDGAIRFTTIDVETREATHTPMVQFENLEYMSGMWVMPGTERVLFSGGPHHNLRYIYIANIDGTEAQEIERFRSVHGISFGGGGGLELSPDGRSMLFRGADVMLLLPIGEGNVPAAEPVCVTCEGLVFEGDTLRHIVGSNWGDDENHIVIAASDVAIPGVIDSYDLHIYLIDIETQSIERRLTTQPIRAIGLSLAPGGRTAIASRSVIDSQGFDRRERDLITEHGTVPWPLPLPSGYTAPTVGNASVMQWRWGQDGRHLVANQKLTEAPPGLDEPYAIGVIDSEDPELTWQEYGEVNLGSRIRPVPRFSK